VTLAHGAGGEATRRLVEGLFAEALGNDALAPLSDSAIVPGATRLALTTDAYVVRPLRFPGGDIGSLAVHGTVNDLAVSGAIPRWLTAGFVLEEGFSIAELRTIVTSMAAAAREAGVDVVAGDTKVVERGKADGLYVTTAGVGALPDGVDLSPARVRPGDRVLLSGTLADHGMAVLVARGDLALEADIASDTAPVHELAAALVALGDDLRWMRDPTRGGLATALNDLAGDAGLSVRLDEAALPVHPTVVGACEVLGIDPLYVANEGKLVAVVAPEAADEALALLRSHPLGVRAAIVGVVQDDPDALVLLDTALGGSRIVDVMVGDPLPRIC
jgi:hydrogenase expression/formation protein HypE